MCPECKFWDGGGLGCWFAGFAWCATGDQRPSLTRHFTYDLGRMGKLLWIFMRHQFEGVSIGVMQEVFWFQNTVPFKLLARFSFFKISISNDSSYCVSCQILAWWCCCYCAVQSAHWDCKWFAQFPLTLWINNMDGLPMTSFNHWHLGYDKRTGLTHAHSESCTVPLWNLSDSLECNDTGNIGIYPCGIEGWAWEPWGWCEGDLFLFIFLFFSMYCIGFRG